MCGFAGLVGPPSDRELLTDQVRAMASTLAHRGPDDSGEWADAGGVVALGFRRLSIIDLSPEGHQPMASADGRYTVVFNGEIYNFAALRSELEALGARFRGHSDTEVMLAAFSAWGVEVTVPRLWGMFAIALWDSYERRLHLIRDRLGKKPLYYGWFGDRFLFGSELKSLRAHPAFQVTVDRGSLMQFLRFAYVPSPASIYREVSKLPPASRLVVDPAAPSADLVPRRYWDPVAIARDGQRQPRRISDEQAIEEANALVSDAVRLRSIADVPLGAFLSGGIDSSVVVAHMQAQSPRGVATFTIGYGSSGYDESTHAAAIARRLGTAHTELQVSPEETRAVIPRLPTLYDEPFADASQIPTFLVSELARRHVTVALSGDGGDEVFGGYNRYVAGTRLWARVGRVPRPVRQAGVRVLEGVPPGAWDRVGALTDRLLPKRRRGVIGGNTVHKLASVVGVGSIEEVYARLVSQWPDPAAVMPDGIEPPIPWADWRIELAEPAHRMMLLDLMSYLPDDILVKVDRASMGCSLEARAPLLDHRLVEFAWQLPLDQKIRGGESKWLLRRILERHVPKALFDRPKQGFGVPIDEWLRGPLRPWAEDLLAEDRLRREGFFDATVVQGAFRTHLEGRRNLQYQLWPILMFEAWLDLERGEGRGS